MGRMGPVTFMIGILAIAMITLAVLGLAGVPDAPPPCAGEDGGPYPCVWDGPNRGNHQGDRVIIWHAP
jgi:hypothetical protein